MTQLWDGTLTGGKGAPTSARIVEDILRFPKAVKAIIAAKGARLEGANKYFATSAMASAFLNGESETSFTAISMAKLILFTRHDERPIVRSPSLYHALADRRRACS